MIHDTLWYGADYNPEQWLDRPDILQNDIELMKKAHVNVVSLGIFSWSTLEPREGEFDFGWMEEIIERLYAAGIFVDLATPSGARPAWLAYRYPEVRRVDENRVRQLFGTRHNHCYTSPVYREKVRRMDQELARRFGRHPAVILWHISNEFGGECHCELCQQAFREWLIGRYGSLDAINRAWNTRFWSHDYTELSQIQSPAPHGETSIQGLSLDWKRFVSHQTIDFMKWERDSVREIVPDAKVCVNMMDRYDRIDYFDMAREIDLASWDAYPQWHALGETPEETAISNALMHDLVYSLKGGPYWLMENTPSYVNWRPVCKPKKPGVNILSGLQTIAHGGDSVLYFQWRQSRGSAEKFHGAIVSHDGREDNRIFVETARLGALLERLSPIAGTPKEKQAAIVYDWAAHWALDGSQGPRNAGMDLWGEITRHYAALARIGVGVDFVNEDGDLTGYKLVIAPILYLLREDFARKLRDFTARGGTLVVTYWSGVVNETDLCWLGDAPHGLTDVLGLRRAEFVPLYDGETVRCVPADPAAPGETRASVFCEIAALEGAQPLMLFAEDYFRGAPAVARHDFGKGRAYTLAARFDEGFYKPFYAALCRTILTPAWPEALPDGVLAVKRGEYVFLQNTLETAARLRALELAPYGTAVFRSCPGGMDRLL